MTNNLRVGIVGYGKMGRIRARAMTEVGGADILAVYDPQSDLSADGFGPGMVRPSFLRTRMDPRRTKLAPKNSFFI